MTQYLCLQTSATLQLHLDDGTAVTRIGDLPAKARVLLKAKVQAWPAPLVVASAAELATTLPAVHENDVS